MTKRALLPPDHLFAGLPAGKASCLLIDPPWRFKSRTALKTRNWNSARDVEKHYATMTIDDIMALPVRDLAARDAHCFLWVTGPFIDKAPAVLKSWGFRYSSVVFVWVKLKRSHNPNQLRFLPTAESDLHVGLGLTSRQNAEYVLLGRRGSPKRLAKNIRQIILAPVREHSRKPDEVFDRIERYCIGPRLELFSRQRRPGWTAWGNDMDRFPAAA